MLGLTSGEWGLIAAIIGVVGLFLYGCLAWLFKNLVDFFKRIVDQLEKLTEITRDLHTEISTLNTRVTFIENKVGTTLGIVALKNNPEGENK